VKERLGEVLELFPVLREKLAKRGGTLSGGEQQMLAFARALMSDPSVLLLDEPSLGLSPKYVKEVFEKIKEINEKRKISIMVVEHNIKSLFSVAGRVYVLDKGRVAAEGDPQTMIDSNIIEKVFLGKLES
jgi:branched-chain amino acid transport system ATP-binding protein